MSLNVKEFDRIIVNVLDKYFNNKGKKIINYQRDDVDILLNEPIFYDELLGAVVVSYPVIIKLLDRELFKQRLLEIMLCKRYTHVMNTLYRITNNRDMIANSDIYHANIDELYSKYMNKGIL